VRTRKSETNVRWRCGKLVVKGSVDTLLRRIKIRENPGSVVIDCYLERRRRASGWSAPV
jgi:hypothetical protein